MKELYTFKEFKLQLVAGLSQEEQKIAYMQYLQANRARVGLSLIEARDYYSDQVTNHKMRDLLKMIESTFIREALVLTSKEDEASTVSEIESMFRGFSEDQILEIGLDNDYISIEDIDNNSNNNTITREGYTYEV